MTVRTEQVVGPLILAEKGSWPLRCPAPTTCWHCQPLRPQTFSSADSLAPLRVPALATFPSHKLRRKH